jgi:hypothetical protein
LRPPIDDVSCDCAQTLAWIWASAFWLVFAGAMVVNGLVGAGVGVPLTTADVSATHPVYLTPVSYAFSVWILSMRIVALA